jgi:hypothetical protein
VINKKKTTTIRAFGDAWRVPRGFGRAYRTVARDHERWLAAGKPGKISDEVVDLIELIGYTATHEEVAEWNARRRVEACVWAATEYARASDNPVQRHPRPSWLTQDPWRGPPVDVSRVRADLRGAFAGPTPTPIAGAT